MYDRVLITGAGGFIGSHLVRSQLALGRRVRALDLHLARIEETSDPNLELVQGDFTDPTVQREAVDGVDLVFHLASAHLEVSLSDDAYWHVNVHAIRPFLESCRDAGVQRFVHVSSVGVHGTIENPPANEESPCHPELLYERTKYEGELRVREFSEAEGLPIVIIRPTWVYGPGCPRTRRLFDSIRKGRFFFVGDGSALRHCVHIDDFADAMEMAAQRQEAVGRTYIIGDREAATLEYLVGEIANTVGVRAPRLRLPRWLVGAAGLLMELAFYPLRRDPPISRRTLRFFTGNTAFDTSRAQDELGFAPRYELATGLRAYGEWLSLARTGRLQDGRERQMAQE